MLILGCATAILFGGIMGLASLYPPTYTGAVMVSILKNDRVNVRD